VTSGRSLDDWYLAVNRLYLDRNFYRDEFSIFAHLVEVMGGLSLLSSGKEKEGVSPETFIPKAIAWWLALCGRVGVRSVEQMLWWKFPYACTYCQQPRCLGDECARRKLDAAAAGLPVPDWDRLEAIGRGVENRAVLEGDVLRKRPRTLAEWCDMFGTLYPVTQTETYPPTFGRFTEELGELGEALRVFPIAPGYLLSEAADVFAWLMHLQHLVQRKAPLLERGLLLERSFAAAYSQGCKDCGAEVCACPPILPSTLGRIAHEVPEGRASFSAGGALLSTADAMELFSPGAKVVTVNGTVFDVTGDLLREINAGVRDLLRLAYRSDHSEAFQNEALMEALYEVRGLTDRQRITDEALEELRAAVADLAPSARQLFIDFLTGVNASLGAALIAMLLGA
jgi:NTP pyrophosphatase (non-canonical NTP hydrolase)